MTTTKSETPQDRLTRVCDGMITAFNQHAEKLEDDRAVVLVNDGTRGGICIAGYEDEDDAVVDLVMHLRAIFRARGMDLHFVQAGDTPPKDRS